MEEYNSNQINFSKSGVEDNFSDIENNEEDENLINNYNLVILFSKVTKGIDKMNINNKNFEYNENFRKRIKERINESNKNLSKNKFNLDNKAYKKRKD